MGIRASSETKLLDAAEELFFARGISATPIDAVIASAGVSPATLYRGYTGKDDLVAAVLARRHDHWVQAWEDAIARGTTVADRLLAVFDALDDFRARPHAARWCAFLGTAAEYVEPPTGIEQAVARDTESLRSRLSELAEPLGEPRGSVVTDELLLLVTGYLAMRLRDPDHSTATARRIAAGLVADP